MRYRAAFLAGLIAAALAALPAALRFDSSLVGQAFVVLTAGAALVMAPLSAALSSASPPSQFSRALTVGALVSVVPLLPFAAMLKTGTHHRPLGGATFAVIAGLIIVGCSLVCARLITWAREQRSPIGTWARFALVALAALGTAAVLLALLQGIRSDSAYRTGFFDALRALGLATLASRAPLPSGLVRRVRGLGLAAWISVVTVGVCLGRAPTMQVALAAHCPVLHWPLVWLGG